MSEKSSAAPGRPKQARAPSGGSEPHEVGSVGAEILLAEPRGFCAGVDRAIEIVERALAKFGRPIYVRHEIVHNTYVVNDLKDKGAIFIEELDEVPPGATLLFSAHGVSQAVQKEAERRGFRIFDATCPLVTKVQRLAQKLVRQGYYLVVYGDHYHPEVRSVIGWAGTSKAVAVKKIADLPWNAPRGSTAPGAVTPPRKVAVVSQTTKNVDELMAFAQELQAMVMPEGGEFRLCNTICEPTSERQRALKRLVEEDHVDLILAIGGRKSSNTARLAEVGQSMGVTSFHIERPEEITAEWLQDVTTVGVTAGASTPDDVIEAVVAYLAERGYAPPPGGIRPVDPDYIPAY